MQVFHITLEGPDSDFGPISHEHVKITIQDKGTWDKELIDEFKQMLADFYDCSPKEILTDEEEKKEAESLNEYLKKEHIEQFNMYQRMQPTRKLKMTRIPRWTHKQFKDYTIDAYEKNRVIQSEIS